jgi:hypothetical protein
MSRRTLIPLLAAGLLAVAAPSALASGGTAKPPEVAQALPEAALRGEGRLRFLGLHVYDARLWAPEPVPADAWPGATLALELAYARTLQGRAIAERSLQEMRRQGEIAPDQAERWLGEMARLFPDVRDGDRLTGLYRPGRGAAFFHNGQPRGEVADPEFARRFFGIWLAPQTSEPSLRERLLSGGR